MKQNAEVSNDAICKGTNDGILNFGLLGVRNAQGLVLKKINLPLSMP
jgi:hypothetical protein